MWLFYPKVRLQGVENLPEGPAIIVGNHAQMNGPIVSEIYIPGKHYTWTVGQMMHAKEVQPYAFNDFWSKKPKYIRWFYKILSYVIVPFSVCAFNNAHCIGVYHDIRMLSTFRDTNKVLEEGAKVVILPEKHQAPHNNIVCEFQEGFVDAARMYYRKNHAEISFVPMYICPALKSIYFGKPVKYDSSAKAADERIRISNAMMDGITEIARSLPEHTVVPYPNIPRRIYPTNKEIHKAFDENGVFELEETDNS